MVAVLRGSLSSSSYARHRQECASLATTGMLRLEEVWLDAATPVRFLVFSPLAALFNPRSVLKYSGRFHWLCRPAVQVGEREFGTTSGKPPGPHKHQQMRERERELGQQLNKPEKGLVCFVLKMNKCGFHR